MGNKNSFFFLTSMFYLDTRYALAKIGRSGMKGSEKKKKRRSCFSPTGSYVATSFTSF